MEENRLSHRFDWKARHSNYCIFVTPQRQCLWLDLPWVLPLRVQDYHDILTCASSHGIQRQHSNNSLNKKQLLHHRISHGSHWGQSQLIGGPVPTKQCRAQALVRTAPSWHPPRWHATAEPASQGSAALLPPNLLREVKKKSFCASLLLSFGQPKCRSTQSSSDYLEAQTVQTDLFFSVKGASPKQQGKIDFVRFLSRDS